MSIESIFLGGPSSRIWRRQWHPTLVLLPGKSHGRRSLVGWSLVGYSPWGLEESDMTEWLHFHFSLSCTGKGNGNPLQYSCLENPRDGRVWWAAVHRVGHDWSDLAAAAAVAINLTVHNSIGMYLFHTLLDLFFHEWDCLVTFTYCFRITFYAIFETEFEGCFLHPEIVCAGLELFFLLRICW